MATPLDNALKRLAELQREIAEVERFIELYQGFEKGTEAAQTTSRDKSATRPLEGNLSPEKDDNAVDNSGVRRRRGARPSEIAAIMERVIRERGEPMSRGEIVDALERREIVIPAEDKARYVGTIAWRHKGTFYNIDGRGYWLRSEPFRIHAPLDGDQERELPLTEIEPSK